MSAMAPAGIEISITGNISAVCTSATLSADDAIWVIAQAAPTPWIRRPRLESRLASQIRRKAECRSGAATPSADNIERFGCCVIARPVDARGRPLIPHLLQCCLRKSGAVQCPGPGHEHPNEPEDPKEAITVCFFSAR